MRGVDLFFANVKGPVWDVMRRSGFIDELGEDHFQLTTHEAVQKAKAIAEDRVYEKESSETYDATK